MTCKEIAVKFGVSYDAVVAAAHSAGFSLKRGRAPIQFTSDEIDLIMSKIAKKRSKKDMPVKKNAAVVEKKPTAEIKPTVYKKVVEDNSKDDETSDYFEDVEMVDFDDDDDMDDFEDDEIDDFEDDDDDE